MKKSRDIIIATITALILLTGCANEIEHKQGNDKIEMSASQFIIDETPYAEDTEVTRSRNVANAPFGKEIIKLDNGIEAEVTVEREVADNTHHATTRTTEMTNQHYTIYQRNRQRCRKFKKIHTRCWNIFHAITRTWHLHLRVS